MIGTGKDKFRMNLKHYEKKNCRLFIWKLIKTTDLHYKGKTHSQISIIAMSLRVCVSRVPHSTKMLRLWVFVPSIFNSNLSLHMFLSVTVCTLNCKFISEILEHQESLCSHWTYFTSTGENRIYLSICLSVFLTIYISISNHFELCGIGTNARNFWLNIWSIIALKLRFSLQCISRMTKRNNGIFHWIYHLALLPKGTMENHFSDQFLSCCVHELLDEIQHHSFTIHDLQNKIMADIQHHLSLFMIFKTK